MRLDYRAFVFVSVIEFSSGCSNREPESPKPAIPQKTAQTVTAPPVVTKTASTTVAMNGLYRSYHIDGASSLASLQKELGANGMQLVYKFNRRDLAHIKEHDSLLVPNKGDSEAVYAPFPSRLDSSLSVGKLLVISRRVQAFAAYENGKLVKWGPTSTGKKSTPTPEGLYHTNWKSKQTHSTVNGDWILNWYFNLDNLEGISLHEYELPGYPASHSCVRLLSDDAKWIYDWAEQWTLSADRSKVLQNGTSVVVFGSYSYGKVPPWKQLFSNDTATNIPSEELNDALHTYLSTTTSAQRVTE